MQAMCRIYLSLSVLAPNIDDIPSTNDHIFTYTGTHAAGRANHNVSCVQITSNEQNVWFYGQHKSRSRTHLL
jgi:hypothetical protein